MFLNYSYKCKLEIIWIYFFSLKVSVFLAAHVNNKKKFVFVSALIHPGETNSSFMMCSVLEYITFSDE